MKYLDEKTDTVIFDLGQVLLRYDWESYLQSFAYSKDQYEAIAEAVFQNEDWEKGDEGIVTPKEWEALFVNNAPLYEAEIRKVYASMEETIAPMEYTEKWLAVFRGRGCRMFYLSNYSEYLHEKTKKHMGFLNTFDGGIFSYQEKCIKPGSEIYQILLERYQINPETSVFFDDRPENVEAAEKFGIKGVVFTPQVAYEMLQESVEI